jgi:hypothetical protein
LKSYNFSKIRMVNHSNLPPFFDEHPDFFLGTMGFIITICQNGFERGDGLVR